jgi:drug/metabolite transporter (DMT)-like permease
VLAHGSAFLVITLWAGTYVLTKLALREMGPVSLAFCRNGSASIILVLWFLSTRPRTILPRVADYPALLGLGICGVGMFYLLQNLGLGYTTATDTALLITASPAMIAALAVVALGEVLSVRHAAGIGLASVGAISLAIGGSGAAHGGPTVTGRLVGDTIVALTALGWALYTV